MAAIGGMIYVARQTAANRESLITQVAATTTTTSDPSISHGTLAKPHWLGLTLLLPIPFISFFVLYFFWRKSPNHSAQVELEYKQAISFQITVHLYALLSFFLMFILIGLLLFVMVLALHFLATVYVAVKTQTGANTQYWANIRIV